MAWPNEEQEVKKSKNKQIGMWLDKVFWFKWNKTFMKLLNFDLMDNYLYAISFNEKLSTNVIGVCLFHW